MKRGWCVKDEDGLVLETVRQTRKDAVEAYLDFECGWPNDEWKWREVMKEKKARTVMVMVVEQKAQRLRATLALSEGLKGEV